MFELPSDKDSKVLKAYIASVIYSKTIISSLFYIYNIS